MENIIIRNGTSLGNNLFVHDEPTKEQIIYQKRFNPTVIFHGFFQTRKPVAIKRIPLSQTYRPDILECKKMRMEARNLMNLSGHPNILKFYGVEKNDDFCYIATELCKCTLEKLLADYPAIKFETKKGILIQVTRALHYLHRKEIIHRDIKPENIFIADDYGLNTDPPKIKLADFGSSIHLRVNQEDNFVNEDKNNPISWGTRGWMAPEWYLNPNLQDTASSSKIDIFSLGLVFAYTLCVGRKHPFGNTQDEAQNNINSNEPMTIDKKSLDIQDMITRKRIFELIENMVQFDPTQRCNISHVLETIQIRPVIGTSRLKCQRHQRHIRRQRYPKRQRLMSIKKRQRN